MIKVLIADDQAVVRAGLRMIMQSANDITVVGEASDGREALRLVTDLNPDVVLMDIRMPVMDGIEATRRLRGGGPRVLVLTTYALDEYVYDALRAGAAGFLLKTDSPPDIVDAVRAVNQGDTLLAPEITRRVIARFVAGRRPAEPSGAMSELTDREREVLTHLARGLSNAEIAGALHIGAGTVKSHVASILSKLDLRDRVQAVVFAYEAGILPLEAEPGPGGPGRGSSS